MDEVKQAPSVNFAPGKRKTTCSNCRRRKSKCDGRQPQCSTCQTHKSQCHYDKPPSLAYVRALEAKIEQLMQEKLMHNSGDSWIEIDGKTGQKSQESSSLLSGSPLDSYSRGDISEQNSPSQHTSIESPDTKRNCDRWVSEISVDSHGEVCYHNPTSAIHEAPSTERRLSNGVRLSACSPERMSAISHDNPNQTEEIKHALVSNAATQRRFEAVAVENMTAVQNEVSSEMASELLKLHWCWIHPMFMFVYRPAFTRKFTPFFPWFTAEIYVGDMARSITNVPETSYFSDTLLKVILAHSVRFLVKKAGNNDAANAFMETLTNQAHFSLAVKISSPSSIPTIQALLQQSARETAFGRSSQAWLYSGMAFRMAIDMGIHLPSDKLQAYVKTLTAEDIEIRKRLFWSCYTWDKAISLYLGRMPAFSPPMDSIGTDFMDDFTENDPWEPYYGSDSQDGGNAKVPYPPQKGHVISCFTALCRLSIILSTIMREIYGSSPVAEESLQSTGPASSHKPLHNRTKAQSMKNSAFVRICFEIQVWWQELPDVLRLNVKNLPRLSPPLHIVSLNLLYQTTLILLHRPFILSSTEFENPAVLRSYLICITATAAIHDLLELLTTTFGYSHITYLNCYSTYIGATIAVLHFQRQEENSNLPDSDLPGQKLDLKFFLEIMQRTALRMPALSRSVEIVKRHMQVILDRRAKRYLDSLFPVQDTNASSSYKSPELVQDRSGHSFNVQQEQFARGTGSSSQTSTVMQDPAQGNFQMSSGFNLEGLPAFPGQNFNVGTDYPLDHEITDPETRAALMALNMDPHLTLHHENADWSYAGFYMGNEMQ